MNLGTNPIKVKISISDHQLLWNNPNALEALLQGQLVEYVYTFLINGNSEVPPSSLKF